MAAVGRKALVLLASQVVGSVMGYGAILVIGRYFPPAAYGAWAVAFAAGSLLVILMNLGFGEAFVHFVARGADTGRALGVFLRLRLALTALTVLLVLAAAWLYTGPLGGELTDATTWPVFWLALATMVLSVVRQMPLDLWLGRQQVHRTEAIKTLDTALNLVLLAALGVALAAQEGRWTPVGPLAPALADLLGVTRPWSVPEIAIGLALCTLAAKAATLLPTLAWWSRDRVPPGPWDRKLARQHWDYARPIALAGAVAIALGATDIIMLGFFHTTADTGLYGMAQRVSGLALLAATAVGTILLPFFSQVLGGGRHAEAARALGLAERYLLILTLPVAAAFVALPGPVLHVAVGDQYLDAAVPLAILGGLAVVFAASVPLRLKLMGGGFPKETLRASILNTVLNALLNLWFIPDAPGLGLKGAGAALGTLLSTLVTYVYLRLRVRRHFGVPFWNGRLAHITLAGAGLAALWALAHQSLGASAFAHAWQLVAWGGAGTLLFLGWLVLLGELRGPDLRYFASLVSPGGLWRELSGRGGTPPEGDDDPPMPPQGT
ncbi:MAG: hypothetical protein QOD77_1914 [Thermoplasmata archaeon]|nr:hypothetical protein [Thermoplasmata archaeon]